MTGKVNNLRKYMFIARTPDINSTNIIDIDRFTELKDPNRLIELETQFNLRIRLNPDMYDTPLMITGDNLELDGNSLSEYLNSMSRSEMIKFLKRAEI